MCKTNIHLHAQYMEQTMDSLHIFLSHSSHEGQGTQLIKIIFGCYNFLSPLKFASHFGVHTTITRT